MLDLGLDLEASCRVVPVANEDPVADDNQRNSQRLTL